MDTCAFTHEHPRTRRWTIHPCTLTTTLTKNTTNYCISAHIWISLASVCIFFRASVVAPYQIFVGQRENGSWQLLVVARLGDSRERRVVGQVGVFHRQRPWVAKQRVRQRVAAIKRGDPSPRYVGGIPRRLTPELLDEIREFMDEECGRFL